MTTSRKPRECAPGGVSKMPHKNHPKDRIDGDRSKRVIPLAMGEAISAADLKGFLKEGRVSNKLRPFVESAEDERAALEESYGPDISAACRSALSEVGWG